MNAVTSDRPITTVTTFLSMALYHKYRPQSFADIVGQTHIVQTIQNQVENDTVAHAYLFSGPRGVGKTTTARLLAKAINCPKIKGSKSEPDNKSACAIDISEGRSIDVIEIDAASHTGVDNVRENIIENAQFRPTTLPYKVFIIDEVHMLSTSAFNALLKTLEEPPAHVIFVLATTEPHKLPDTIISRCQRFTFERIDFDTMKAHLQSIAKAEGVTVADDVLERIINKSDGCARDAVSLLDQILATGKKNITAAEAALVLPTSHHEETIAFVKALAEKNAAEALSTLHTMHQNGVDMMQFSQDVLEVLHITMMAQLDAKMPMQSLDLSADAVNIITEQATRFSSHELLSLTDMVMMRRSQIRRSPLPTLPLEMVVFAWCGDAGESSRTPAATSPKSTTQKASAKPVDDNVPATKVEEKKEEKPTVVEKVKEIISSGDPICTIDEAQKRWPEVVKRIEQASPSLVFILNMASVTAVNGSTVELTVGYAFHRDKLMDVQCRKMVDEAFTAVFGQSVSIDVKVDASAQQDVEPHSPQLKELASALGGEIVS